MENRIRELEDDIRALMLRIEEGVLKQNEMASKIEFLESELESSAQIDLGVIDQAKSQSLKQKQSRVEKRRLVGYKVIKYNMECSEELENTVIQHIQEGWVIHEGLCFADRYLCQALVKYI